MEAGLARPGGDNFTYYNILLRKSLICRNKDSWGSGTIYLSVVSCADVILAQWIYSPNRIIWHHLSIHLFVVALPMQWQTTYFINWVLRLRSGMKGWEKRLLAVLGWFSKDTFLFWKWRVMSKRNLLSRCLPAASVWQRWISSQRNCKLSQNETSSPGASNHGWHLASVAFRFSFSLVGIIKFWHRKTNPNCGKRATFTFPTSIDLLPSTNWFALYQEVWSWNVENKTGCNKRAEMRVEELRASTFSMLQS